MHLHSLTNDSLDLICFLNVVAFVFPLCDFTVSLEQGVAVNIEMLVFRLIICLVGTYCPGSVK